MRGGAEHLSDTSRRSFHGGRKRSHTRRGESALAIRQAIHSIRACLEECRGSSGVSIPMKARRKTICALLAICCAALVCGAGLARGAETYSLGHSAGALPAELPAALRDAVATDSLEVKGAGGVLCDVWLRKEVPLAATASQELGVTFGQIAEGTLVGVVRIGTDTTDYRNQKVKAGLYTLRYAFAPVDGNHS